MGGAPVSDRAVTSVPVLVTGATGFIGQKLVSELLRQNYRVTVLLREGKSLPSYLQSRVQAVYFSSLEPSSIALLLHDHKFEVVYHLAAYGVRPTDRDPSLMSAVNIHWPMNLARLAADRGAVFVMAGSSAEYRATESEMLLAENAALEIIRPYGASKAEGGLAAHSISSELGTSFVLLRLFNVFGPGEAPHRLFPMLQSLLLQDKMVPLSDGSQIRDFIFVDDVVRAFITAGIGARAQPLRTIVNICSGEGHSVRRFAECTATVLGKFSGLLNFGALPQRKDDIPWLVGSPNCAFKQLGFTTHYNLTSGIQKAVDTVKLQKGIEGDF